MVRPVNFTFNAQTAVNNAFQVAGKDAGVQAEAIKEFDSFVEKLQSKNIDVIVVPDTHEPHTPDSIFPNNWISFHDDGSMILYPMFAHNRRLERKPAVLQEIKNKFTVNNIFDLTRYEEQNKFLEGTGSMVLDRDKRIAYACLSPRTDKELFNQFCNEMKFYGVSFNAIDKKGKTIYHTNVMMCVADRYIVICLECIGDKAEKETVEATIKNSGKDLIEISMDQMNRFAGNMLQVNNSTGEKFLVMSTQAYNSLTPAQLKKLQSYNKILHSSLNTIETNGGGSARCMMAEIHLPFKS